MNELSLFSGAGGGLLGTILLGFRPVGYVEIDDYCQRVIAARIRDGILPNAPIFDNIKTFISEGYAASYTDLVDVLTAGFPCQPFSLAGKRKGADDDRNMWPKTADVIGVVRPRFVLLENVPGIRKYLPVVVRDLRRLGYEVRRPLQLGADDIGAPHRRKRVWIAANRLSDGRNAGASPMSGQESWAAFSCDADRKPSNAEILHDRGNIGKEKKGQIQQPRNCFEQGTAPDSSQRQDDGRDGREVDFATEGGKGFDSSARACDSDASNTIGKRCKKQRGRFQISEEHDPSKWGLWAENWPEVATRLCRVDDGVAFRVDRLKALGNGQVPTVVRLAWNILNR